MFYFNQKDIREEATKYLNYLQKMKKDIEGKEIKLKEIIRQEISFKGAEIVDILQSTSTLIESFDKEFESMFKSTNAQLIDSLILKEETYQNFVYKDLVDGKEMKLIYRGSQDGFTTSDFHRKCDN